MALSLGAINTFRHVSSKKKTFRNLDNGVISEMHCGYFMQSPFHLVKRLSNPGPHKALALLRQVSKPFWMKYQTCSQLTSTPPHHSCPNHCTVLARCRSIGKEQKSRAVHENCLQHFYHHTFSAKLVVGWGLNRGKSTKAGLIVYNVLHKSIATIYSHMPKLVNECKDKSRKHIR